VKALVIKSPGEAAVEFIAEPRPGSDEVLLKVRRIGLCGSDLNCFRGKNPLVTFPRIPGHEVAATIVEGDKKRNLVSGRTSRCRPIPAVAAVLPALATVGMLASTIRPSVCNGTGH
jgi:threonine dehydrogenase-like Zn-dependent dehydrogenase